MTQDQLEVILGLLVAIVVLVTVARRPNIAYPILLVVGGLALGFVPGLPASPSRPSSSSCSSCRRSSIGRR